MKLLYITNGITGSGGLERVLSVKASWLANHFDYEVHIIGLNEDVLKPTFFDFSKRIVRHNLQVAGNPAVYLKKYISGIKKLVAEINPYVISVCDDGLKGFFIPKIIGNKRPVIYERHVSKLISSEEKTGVSKTFAELQFKIMNRLAKSFDAFVVLTEGNKNEWPGLKNIHVIPNPLPFYPEDSSALTEKKVIAVGKYSYQKGFDLLLEGWSKLPEHLRDWQLHLYGKQDNIKQLETQAYASAIKDSVFFNPPDKNIENRFLESSVFVLSSRYEGFGMVIIEAMACGLPAVSFDCPYGPSDIITDGNDGFLVKNGDTSALAEKLSTIMADASLRSEMGKSAKENVQNFLPENMVKKWDALFKKLSS